MENQKGGKGKIIGIAVAAIVVLAAVFCWVGGIVGGINETEAKEIALKQVDGTGSEQVMVLKEFDDFRMVYEVQVVSDNVLHEFTIAARNGKILSREFEGNMSNRQETPGTDETQQSDRTDIGVEKAKKIALAQVPGAATDDITAAQADNTNGALIYEVEIRYDGQEYDFDIDAATGEIVEKSQESVPD